MRIGQGYDIHKLVKERDLILGGVKIPHETGLLGHSDADVLIHAIIDALFGAAALGDIGGYFPDNSQEFENANSIALLARAGEILNDKGYKILNVDSTVICQGPKLAPYKNAMRENIARVLCISVENVSVKAKTKEEMDAIGQGLAIEAQAVVIID